MNNPSHEKKTSNALKADRVTHRVTFNPNKASPGEILHIPVPKLNDGVVLVPGTLALIFDLTVSGHANNFLVNNVARALVDRFTVKFAGEILQDTNGYDLIKLYEDLFLTEKREWVGYQKEFSLKTSQKLDVAQETRRLRESPRKLNSMMFMGVGIEFRLTTTFWMIMESSSREH